MIGENDAKRFNRLDKGINTEYSMLINFLQGYGSRQQQLYEYEGAKHGLTLLWETGLYRDMRGWEVICKKVIK